MKLVIHAHALKNESLSQAITAHFDERGGTIGRSDTNTLTLPDPERHVSRLQAEVVFAGRGFSIRNVGSANPIEINGKTLRPGEGAPLAAGDQLVIGGYAMRVVAESNPGVALANPAPRVDPRTVIRASAGEVRTDPPPRPAPPSQPQVAAPAAAVPARRQPEPAAPPAADPFADLMGGAGPASATDPFADLLAVPPPRSSVFVPPRVPVPSPSPATRQPTLPPVARLPDDFDPFADLAPAAKSPAGADLADFMAAPSGRPTELPARKSLPADSGLDDLLGLSRGGGAGSSGTSIDIMFGLGGGKGSAELLDDFLSPGKGTGGTARGDVLDLFAETTDHAASPTAPAAFNHTPELSGAYSPPLVKAAPTTAFKRPAAAEPQPLAPAAPATPFARTRDETSPRPRVTAAAPLGPAALAPQGAASPEALWRAFCEGAGIALQLPAGLTPQTMNAMGQVLRHAVEGTLKLVAARATAKQELRAQVTTIQSKNNNPLKFSVDPQQALAQLLQPPMRGFMPGPDAVRDAMDDLLGHHIGTMAGTRAALQGMLTRFEPSRLEAKLANKGVIDAVLPMNRRAKLWELYVQHYQHVQDEAQDDFHELFGKAFVKAYEQQLDRLEASRRKAG